MARRGFALLLLAGACGPSEGPKGQCKDSLVVGDLVITEVFADFKAEVGGSGADEGKEWFEIYNASDRPIELEGLRVDHSRPNGDKLKSHVMTAVTIAPGQYLTLGNATPDLVPAYIDYGYSADLGDFFNSDGGRLALSCGDSEIDGSDYDTVKEGRSRQLTASTFPDYTLNDDLANWCEAGGAEFEAGNFGTPGGDNDCTPVILGVCNDAGTMRPVVAPTPGQLVITEVMPSPDGDDNMREWFEAKALSSFDLNGLTLDRVNEAANSDTIESPDCISVTAGEYVVFARSLDPLAHKLPSSVEVKGTFGFSMVGGTANSLGDVAILSGTTVIDAVTWTGSSTGASLALDPDLDEDAAANDDENNFCDGTAIYFDGATQVPPEAPATQELGTPGEVNTQCVLLPPAGQCDSGAGNRAFDKPSAGQLVITEYFANPFGTGTDATQEWFEVTNISPDDPLDLNGLGLKGNATTVNVVTSPTCKVLAPGQHAVFAHSIDPAVNGGIDEVAATFTFSIAQSNGSLSVLDGIDTTMVFDAITWTTPSVPDGVSRMLKTPNTNSTDNDNQANFCNNTTDVYGTVATNFGTPGADNNCP